MKKKQQFGFNLLYMTKNRHNKYRHYTTIYYRVKQSTYSNLLYFVLLLLSLNLLFLIASSDCVDGDSDVVEVSFPSPVVLLPLLSTACNSCHLFILLLPPFNTSMHIISYDVDDVYQLID